jgi:hypothetical protein
VTPAEVRAQFPERVCARCDRATTAFWGPEDGRADWCIGGRCGDLAISTPYGRQPNPTYLHYPVSYRIIPADLRAVFFWSDAAVDRLRPQDHVFPAHTLEDRVNRDRLVEVLRGGAVVIRYTGLAKCRVCGVDLGSADLTGYGFVWPEGCEHYATEHDVWPPGAYALLDAAKRAFGNRAWYETQA